MKITKNEQFRLEELFYNGYLKITEEPEYWINGWDEGLSYCYNCAVNQTIELLKTKPNGEYCVDGGWGVEGDSTPFCEVCHQLLSNTLTITGCEEELCHFQTYKFNPLYADDCRSMYKVIQSGGWESWKNQPSELEIIYFQVLYQLCKNILNDNPLIMANNDFRHMWQ